MRDTASCRELNRKAPSGTTACACRRRGLLIKCPQRGAPGVNTNVACSISLHCASRSSAFRRAATGSARTKLCPRAALSLRARTHTARRRARGVKCTTCGARRGVQGSQNANRGAGAQACNIRVGRTTDDAGRRSAGLFFRWPRRAPPPPVARVVDTAALREQRATLRAQHARSFRRQGCAAWRGNDHALLAP